MPTAFETHARRLRFRALGIACRERRIETLLLGHHADDSVETTLWRLSAGAQGAGLAGIPEVARIPECHGIYGVSESGSSITLPAEANGPSSRLQVSLEEKGKGSIRFLPGNVDTDPRDKTNAARLASDLLMHDRPSIATGGIFLCRPLLSIHKKDLVATCGENKIPYVDDPTNFDPTLTARNAVRSLLRSNSLPRALQPPSILSLIRSNHGLLQRLNRLANEVLRAQCRVHNLNLRTGTMIIEFCSDTTWADTEQDAPSSEQLHQIQCIALRRITDLLSPVPVNRYPLQSFSAFTSRVFRDHGGSEGPDGNSLRDYLDKRVSFTLGGMYFNPLAVSPSSEASDGTQPDERNIWLLSRQPFMKGKDTELQIDVPLSNQFPSKKGMPRPDFTPWTLWDNRYWFRFSVQAKPGQQLDQAATPNIDKMPLRIRPFGQTDFARIRDDLGTLTGQDGTGRWHRVLPSPTFTASVARALLASHAPGQTRYTVPVLTLGKAPDSEQTGDADREHLLALPTLGHHLSGRRVKGQMRNSRKLEMFYAGRWWILKWEWMYKMIDTEALRLMGKPVEADAQGTREKV